MNYRTSALLLLLFASTFFCRDAMAQVKAKAISYTLDVYLEVYDPVYYDNTESEDLVAHFEVDLYFSGKDRQTVVRKLSAPIDYDIDFFPLMYSVNTREQFHLDHENRIAFKSQGSPVVLTPSKNRKEIMGYKCREYYFQDAAGTYISFWITEKLPDNVCPIGNFSMDGTVLEILTSNGIHCLANDIAAGEVSADFFKLPPEYETQPINGQQ